MIFVSKISLLLCRYVVDVDLIECNTESLTTSYRDRISQLVRDGKCGVRGAQQLQLVMSLFVAFTCRPAGCKVYILPVLYHMASLHCRPGSG